MRKIYQAANLFEAQILRDRLQAAHLRAEVFNAHAHSAAGALPVTEIYPEVWILEDNDWDLAQRVMGEYQAELQAGNQCERICPKCGEMVPGNFASCWNCGAELAEDC